MGASPIRYLSVCSGIEAATVAWHPLGWVPVGFSEIEKFPAAVLAHHYPNTPNLGDMTQHEQWPIGSGSVDLLVGGTPCQSFSVAGLRKGLADPRGNLALVYLAIADRLRPRWLVWENVPGVLSSSGGRDFGAFLGALGELGYGFAYRVLDAQWFGVAQRRRRVFVVGHLGDWRRAAAVLLERESLRRHPAPSRAKGQGAAANAEASARGSVVYGGSNSECSDTVTSKWSKGSGGPAGNECGLYVAHAIPDTARCVTTGEAKRQDWETCTIISAPVAIQGNLIGRDAGGPHGVGASDEGAMYTLTKADVHGVAVPIQDGRDIDKRQNGIGVGQNGDPAYTLDQTGSQAVAHPVPYDLFQITAPVNRQNRKPGDPCHTLARDNAAHAAVAVDVYNQVIDGDVAATLNAESGAPNHSGPKVMHAMAVRRLTPVECERLQGFPDGYTAIPWRGKPAAECPDGPRYRALGNSMAVPVMRWIGERLAQVDSITGDTA